MARIDQPMRGDVPEFTRNGIKIHYQVQGSGEPLLLIHGLGSSSRDWEMQVEDFALRYTVITLDLRGHGFSSKPPGPYSILLFASDTASLVKELGLGPVHLLGISLGGMVAFQLALDHSGLINKLVIVNSAPELVPASIADLLAYWQRLLIVRVLGMRKMGQVLADRFFTEPGQEGIKAVFIQRWSENHQPSYRAALKAAYGWSVRERLGEIKNQTLVIGADGDFFPTAEKKTYTAMIPGARLVVIQNSKHALPAEKPQEFNQVVLDFLRTS